MNSKSIIELDYGNCKIVRFCGKEAYVKDVSPRTIMWYKADGMLKLAPHSEGQSSVSEVTGELMLQSTRFDLVDLRLPSSRMPDSNYIHHLLFFIYFINDSIWRNDQFSDFFDLLILKQIFCIINL